MFKIISPVLKVGGRGVPFGSLEMTSAFPKILAMQRRYASGFNFLTIAPDDVNNPTMLRLSIR